MQLQEIAGARLEQSSYHLFSEAHARGQIFNLGDGERLGTWRCDGNALLTPIKGLIEVQLNGAEKTMKVGSQLIINPGVTFSVKAVELSSIQIIWMPPFPKLEILE
ncbi:MAG: hypothetical protein OEV28_09235 [Nitrospirota bacterium]|nr:hypothetical protein [Nitrospirota bacterium]